MPLKMIVTSLLFLFGFIPAASSQDSSQFKYNYFFVIDQANNGVETYVSFRDTSHPEFVYLMLVASTNSNPLPTPADEPIPVIQSHYDETYRQNYNLRVNLINSMRQLATLHNSVNAAIKADPEFISILRQGVNLSAVGRSAWIQLLKNDPQLYVELKKSRLNSVAEAYMQANRPYSPTLAERADLGPIFYASAVRSLRNWRAKFEEFNHAFEAL